MQTGFFFPPSLASGLIETGIGRQAETREERGEKGTARTREPEKPLVVHRSLMPLAIDSSSSSRHQDIILPSPPPVIPRLPIANCSVSLAVCSAS